MTDALEPLSLTMEHEAKYNAIKEKLCELDREARDACYQLLVLLVQSRDKANVLSAEWDHSSDKLSPSNRKEVSSLLLGSGGVFFHDDDVVFALSFNYTNVNNAYNISVDFEADPDSSCYRRCPQENKPSPRQRYRSAAPPSPSNATSPDTLRGVPIAVDSQPKSFPTGGPNSAGAVYDDDGPLAQQTSQTPKRCSRIGDGDESPKSSPVSSPRSSYSHDDAASDPRSPSFSPGPARSKRRSRAPTGQRKRRRVVDDNMEDKGPICRECDPPRIITDKTYFKRHMRQMHGEDQGKAYLCPIEESGSICNKAIRDINNVRRHLVNNHKMTRPDANKLVHALEMVSVEGLP
ncbi:hypothetical protein B0H67DRAFT_595679 [Lasiosphaeris hirsuta]|uniref:C2H2-type domain-containing protein n=1 Tax=Lasiosphaeris hirsuta TaxID=260670 RepID=A0AA39ZPF6_9PEZI|nr:hypothetical protein B0H67DRAFT_595679 [Lasiosphaeris hirsuta]